MVSGLPPNVLIINDIGESIDPIDSKLIRMSESDGIPRKYTNIL